VSGLQQREIDPRRAVDVDPLSMREGRGSSCEFGAGLAGLVDARTEAGIAGEFDYANEVEDVLRKVPEQRRQISELEDRQHATRSKLTK
jgi:hypothetical protein